MGRVSATNSVRADPSKIRDLAAVRAAGRYGGPADGDMYRESELNALIEALCGVLVRGAFAEIADRQSANRSSRRPGRPHDAMIPRLAPELLSVFLRFNDRARRQSVTTSINGKITQREAGGSLEFIETVIQPFNRYLTTELGRKRLPAARLSISPRRSLSQCARA